MYNLQEEEVLYFDLYLSGEGPNLLFASNSITSPCLQSPRTTPAGESAQASTDLTKFRVELRPEVLRAPEGTRVEDLQRMLEVMKPLLGYCLDAEYRDTRASFRGKLNLVWDLEQGQVRGLEYAIQEREARDPTALETTPVGDCLHSLLESWRMVAIPSGAFSVNFHVDATREHVDVQEY